MKICPECNGRGYHYVPGPNPDDIDAEGCQDCRGTGIQFLTTNRTEPSVDYDPDEKED